jgi:hypothetical protein
MKFFLLGVVQFYRLCLRPFLSPACRFYPSCSQYGLEAIQNHGAWKGSYLTFRRVCRCQPFCAGGIDLVPSKKINEMN